MTKCWSSTKPCSRSPCRKPSMNAAGGGPTRNKPMRLIFPVSCARAAVALATRGQTQQDDELASPHDRASASDMTMVERATNVRYGSEADICIAKRHVRFTPESRHVRRNSQCPLCANSGLMHRSKMSRYSITSSARVRIVGGTVIPIALAVLRLIRSSNFVGCSTGRSAGFAPLRILSMNAPARRYKAGTFGP